MQARFLSYVLISTTLVILLIAPFTYQMIVGSPIRASLTVGAFAINLTGWLFLKKGLIFPSGAVLVVGYWLFLVILVMVSGGVHSPWLPPQVALVVMAGLVLGGWVGIFLGFLSFSADWVIYYLQRANLVPMNTINTGSVDYWVLFATFTLVSVGILMANRLAQGAIRRAHDNERLYRSLFDRTNDGVYTVGLDIRILAVNQKGADMLGYQVQELVGRPYEELVPQDERTHVKANFDALKEKGMTPLFERTLIRKDGSRFKVEFNATTIKDEKGKLLYYQGVARDVTERKRLEEQLRNSLEEMETLAMQDPLTGLLNRRAMTEHAEAEWHRAQRESRPMCIALVDMDNLKKVNDLKGHEMGDKVIKELASAIKLSKRRYDWAGRWGGDEFLLVLPGANLEEAKEVAERLRTKYVGVDWIRELGGIAMVSIGIACFTGRKGDETNLDRLIAQADQALYKAKEQGRNQVEVYRD